MKKEVICIVCPRGCRMAAAFTENGPEITGNGCKRGKEYAIAECTNPVRTVTSTVRVQGGGLVSVKTRQPIPKEKIMEAMKRIRAAVVQPPIHIGDVLLEDVFGTQIIATGDMGD